MADFDLAVELVLKHEGGLVDNPQDPGGLTNFGISLRSYPQLGEDGIRKLTADDAKAIYLRDFWKPWMMGAPDQRLANVLLDSAVNQGMNTALQLHLIAGNNLQEMVIQRLIRYTHVNKPEFYHAWFSRALDY